MTVFPHHLFLQDNKRQGGRKEKKNKGGGTGIVFLRQIGLQLPP
jgi:hypothetical protein